MFIPWQQLSDEALIGLIDSYCTQLHGLCSDDELDCGPRRLFAAWLVLSASSDLVLFSAEPKKAKTTSTRIGVLHRRTPSA
jgi:hypothetical protein